MKQALIRQAEAMGVGGLNMSRFTSQVLTIVQEQLLWRLFRRLAVSLQDCKITCVIPLHTSDHQFAVVRLNFDECSFEPRDLGLPSMGFQDCAKDFRLRGLSVKLAKITIPPVYDDACWSELEFADHEIFSQVQQAQLTNVLNPLWMTGSMRYQPAKVTSALPSLTGACQVRGDYFVCLSVCLNDGCSWDL